MTRTVTHGLAVLPCKDSTQPQPGNPKHQLQGTGQQDNVSPYAVVAQGALGSDGQMAR